MTLTTLDNLEWLLGPEDTMEDMRTWRMEEPVFWNTASRDRGFSLLHSGTLFMLNGKRIDTCNNQHLKCSHFENYIFSLYNSTIEKMPQVLTLLGPMAHAASLLHHDHHAHGHDQIQQQPQMMKSKMTTKLTSVTMQLKKCTSWATKYPESKLPDKQ